MSMPSMDIFKSTPPTEVLRVESEPPGADARTSQGQSCRTPCELTVQSGGEMTVSFALNGYQPQTVQVRPDVAPTSYNETGMGGRLQPNPVYAELQSVKPPAKKKSPARKQTAQKSAPAAPATAATSAPQQSSGSLQSSSYPWPDPR
jgi:PEGA domain